TRLQAQAAGVLYHQPAQMAALGPDAILSEFRCSPSCTRGLLLGSEPVCPPDCFQYKGTLDVFLKVVRQEGFSRLWRGTNAGLALAVPTKKLYGYYNFWQGRCFFIIIVSVNKLSLPPGMWKTLNGMLYKIIVFCGLGVLGANFAAGFVAGSLAAGATCPRQIEVCVLFGTLYTSRSIIFHLCYMRRLQQSTFARVAWKVGEEPVLFFTPKYIILLLYLF
ncbi:hypothetical protein ACJX0J_008884, partial [Zea mays]